VPGYPLTPLLFLGLSAWTVFFGVSSQPKLSAEIAAVLGVGGLMYFFTSRGKARTPIEADE
jgi:APA family basic amino acid/polyamine antiporter